jgi:hypothetical protein
MKAKFIGFAHSQHVDIVECVLLSNLWKCMKKYGCYYSAQLQDKVLKYTPIELTLVELKLPSIR